MPISSLAVPSRSARLAPDKASITIPPAQGDRETHALIKNVERASRASNAAEIQKNADGSVDIYFGPRAPAGKEANWVPTDPQRGFELMFRLYGPKKEFFDKAWELQDVEKMGAP